MEIQLLDQLLGDDEPLRLAWVIFDVEKHPANFERVCKALTMQVREDLLEIVQKEGSSERLLEEWELRTVLGDEANWLLPYEETRYFLRITDEGAKLV